MTDLKKLKGLIFFCFLIPALCYCKWNKEKELFYVSGIFYDQADTLLRTANALYINKDYKDAIAIYEKMMNQKHADSILILKNITLSSAEIRDIQNAVFYAEQYIQQTSDVDFLKNTAFEKIKNSGSFKQLKKKYSPELNIWAILYLYIAIVGTFIAMILNVKKNADRMANLLMSIFVLMHSLFIIHVCLYITNYKYYFPHTLLSTALFSFLYGPLLYFYFKRTTQHYVFKLKDILHLLPSVCYVIYVFPLYSLPGAEKLKILLNEQKIHAYLVTIIISKLVSLLVYGYLVWRIYKEDHKNVFKEGIMTKWQKNILKFYALYTISYAVYALVITDVIAVAFLYHLQIITISLLVIYVGYVAYTQPYIFGDIISTKNGALFKYQKSGLTEMYSKELKENLIKLLNEEKIYKDNNMNLEILSEKLGTTRHNTSQVINEHFNINFFELINKYRIEEVLEILKEGAHKSLNIIDIAYEVGFNNKVTFNKAFKKETSLTPTQYIEMLARERIH